MNATLQQVERRPVACCNEPVNLTRTEKSPTIYVEHCNVCGRNHHVMEVEPGRVGVRGSAVG